MARFRAGEPSRVVEGELLVGRLIRGCAGISPGCELPGNGFLNGLSKGQIDGSARAGANEVAFIQGQASCQFRYFDKSADPLRRHRRHAQLIPTAPNHFTISADR